MIAAAVILVQGDALAGERAEPKAKVPVRNPARAADRAGAAVFLFLAVYGLATGGIGSQGVVAMVKMGLTDEAGAAQVLSAYQFAIAAGIPPAASLPSGSSATD
ncbi:MAG: hypothetical protein H6844_10580 [Alphaproteobacteria bacterium]|nr:hypothetical protein [Alphaproteobacteria bacterium]